jgi:hypothetical protein
MVCSTCGGKLPLCDDCLDQGTQICLSTAKSYGVPDSLLRRKLNYDAVRNPHYRCAAPMLLFNSAEVIALSRQLSAEKAKAAEKSADLKREKQHEKDVKAAEQKRKWTASASGRKERLIKRSKISPEQIPERLHGVVFGDYLHPVSKPKKLVRDIVASTKLVPSVVVVAAALGLDEQVVYDFHRLVWEQCGGSILDVPFLQARLSRHRLNVWRGVKHNATLICSFLTQTECTSLPPLQRHLEGVEEHLLQHCWHSGAYTAEAHRAALIACHVAAEAKLESAPVLQYLLASPHILEYSTLNKVVFAVKAFSDLVRRVLLAEAVSIRSFLHAGDLKKISTSAAARYFIADAASGETRKQALAAELHRLLPEDSVQWLLQSPACAQRLRYMQDYALDPSTTAKKMVFFFSDRENADERRERLHESLQKKGLQLRGDSNLCNQYITGKLDADLEEIVGIMRITGWLFEIHGHVAWSNYAKPLEATFRLAMYQEGLSADDAFVKAKASFPSSWKAPKPKKRRHYDPGYMYDHLSSSDDDLNYSSDDG